MTMKFMGIQCTCTTFLHRDGLPLAVKRKHTDALTLPQYTAHAFLRMYGDTTRITWFLCCIIYMKRYIAIEF